jgi:beta-lactam-binding protein with PASTA domain
VPVPVVPDVSGDQVGAANATLGTFGLTGNSVLNHTTNCPASSWGLVVGQDPAASMQEPFGLAVSLTVCVPVVVPSVLSQGDQDAQNAITAAGLTVGPVTMRANCTEPRGGVLVQNPDPGVQVTPGTPVSLVESTGRQPNGRPCVIN